MQDNEMTYNEFIQEASVLMRLLSDGIITTDEYDDIMGRTRDYYIEHKPKHKEAIA